jgi:hypothetical protein
MSPIKVTEYTWLLFDDLYKKCIDHKVQYSGAGCRTSPKFNTRPKEIVDTDCTVQSDLKWGRRGKLSLKMSLSSSPWERAFPRKPLILHVFPDHFLASLQQGENRHSGYGPFLALLAHEGKLQQRLEARLGKIFPQFSAGVRVC